jgi:hypothetical protein
VVKLHDSEHQETINQHLYLFDFLDMIGLLAMCNKNALLRSIGCLLVTETGKLKRLLVHKDKHRPSLTDILYQKPSREMTGQVSITDGIIQKLSLFFSLTSEGQNNLATLVMLRQQLSQSMLFKLTIDNFEYSKVGLWESLVRDIQVLFIGDLSRLWKNNILSNSKYGSVMLSFVHQLSSRCV